MSQPKTPKKSTVIKPVPAKDKYKSLGGETGRPTGPTFKISMPKNLSGNAKSGKTIKKAKDGAKFDLNKDGKTTFKDVLIGRGVLPKTAKKGASVKKAKSGMKTCRGGCN
jgi:hypothetical protein